MVPFPTIEDAKDSPDSQTTSSDKLTALPSSMSWTTAPSHARVPRSPGSRNRIFRPSSSLPSLHSPVLASWTIPPSQSPSLPAFPDPPQTPPMPFGIAWSRRRSMSERSVDSMHSGQLTPRPQRVSLNSDRNSLNSLRQAFKRSQRASDANALPSPGSHRSSGATNGSKNERHQVADSPRQPLPSRGSVRAPSPLQMFQQWATRVNLQTRPTLEELDPFIPVDPFERRSHRLRFPSVFSPSAASATPIPSPDAHLPSYCRSKLFSCSLPQFHSNAQTTTSAVAVPVHSDDSNDHYTFLTFIVDTFLCHIYLNLLLRLPALYFSRVARIFEDAEVSKPDIHRMIEVMADPAQVDLESAEAGIPLTPVQSIDSRKTNRARTQARVLLSLASPLHSRSELGEPRVHCDPSLAHRQLPFPEDWTTPIVSPALVRFKKSWEAFIDTLMREWKTLNVLSALLLSAILTIFQIPDAAGDLPTRSAAFMSLICAIMSLLYGCTYIVRFGAMRSMYRACRWAEEARKTDANILWNVWVMLSLPLVSLAWAMVFFLISILMFAWRVTFTTADATNEDSALSTVEYDRHVRNLRSLAASIVVTLLLVLGMAYFVMIVKTLKSYSGCRYHPTSVVMSRPKEHGTADCLPVREPARQRDGECLPEKSTIVIGLGLGLDMKETVPMTVPPP